MCGVSACENMQKRVSHGETVWVGSSGHVLMCCLTLALKKSVDFYAAHVNITPGRRWKLVTGEKSDYTLWPVDVHKVKSHSHSTIVLPHLQSYTVGFPRETGKASQHGCQAVSFLCSWSHPETTKTLPTTSTHPTQNLVLIELWDHSDWISVGFYFRSHDARTSS